MSDASRVIHARVVDTSIWLAHKLPQEKLESDSNEPTISVCPAETGPNKDLQATSVGVDLEWIEDHG